MIYIVYYLLFGFIVNAIASIYVTNKKGLHIYRDGSKHFKNQVSLLQKEQHDGYVLLTDGFLLKSLTFSTGGGFYLRCKNTIYISKLIKDVLTEEESRAILEHERTHLHYKDGGYNYGIIHCLAKELRADYVSSVKTNPKNMFTALIKIVINNIKLLKEDWKLLDDKTQYILVSGLIGNLTYMVLPRLIALHIYMLVNKVINYVK